MKKSKIPVRFTGQHFTINKLLIADSIKVAGLNPEDLVLDIGAGKGFLSAHLVKYCQQIIAVENDRSLVAYLNKKFQDCSKIKIVKRDFRSFRIPAAKFKVVSNIPYGITADILKILLFNNVNNFEGGAIIMQLDAAKKLVDKTIFNPFVMFYRTFFSIDLVCEISPDSFLPPPTIKSALVKIKRKGIVNINLEMKERYLCFLFNMLKEPERTVLSALKTVFRKKQVRLLSLKYRINLDSRVVDLSPFQWANCFKEMLLAVPEKYHPT